MLKTKYSDQIFRKKIHIFYIFLQIYKHSKFKMPITTRAKIENAKATATKSKKTLSLIKTKSSSPIKKIKKATVSDTPEAISYSPKTNSFLESEKIDSKQNYKSFDENNSSINLDNNNKENVSLIFSKIIFSLMNPSFVYSCYLN